MILITQIKLNLLEQEILSNNNTKKIINILDEIIFEINNNWKGKNNPWDMRRLWSYQKSNGNKYGGDEI